MLCSVYSEIIFDTFNVFLVGFVLFEIFDDIGIAAYDTGGVGDRFALRGRGVLGIRKADHGAAKLELKTRTFLGNTGQIPMSGDAGVWIIRFQAA